MAIDEVTVEEIEAAVKEPRSLRVGDLPEQLRICSRCGTKKNLTIHHLKKGSLKRSARTGKCVVLCRSCHDKTHGIKHGNNKDWLTKAKEIVQFEVTFNQTMNSYEVNDK